MIVAAGWPFGAVVPGGAGRAAEAAAGAPAGGWAPVVGAGAVCDVGVGAACGVGAGAGVIDRLGCGGATGSTRSGGRVGTGCVDGGGVWATADDAASRAVAAATLMRVVRSMVDIPFWAEGRKGMSGAAFGRRNVPGGNPRAP